MVQSQRCVTESMFHSSEEKTVESSYSFTHTTKNKKKSCTKHSKEERWRERRRDGIPHGCVAEEEKQRCGSAKRRRDATHARRERRKGRRDERREVHQLLFFFCLLPTGQEWNQALIGGSHGLRPLPIFLLLLPCQAELTERKREMELPRSFSSSQVPPLGDGVGRWGKSARSDQRPHTPPTPFHSHSVSHSVLL